MTKPKPSVYHDFAELWVDNLMKTKDMKAFLKAYTNKMGTYVWQRESLEDHMTKALARKGGTDIASIFLEAYKDDLSKEAIEEIKALQTLEKI